MRFQCLCSARHPVSFTGLVKGDILGRQLFLRLQFITHREHSLSPLHIRVGSFV